jgi:hypothetical protein
MLFCPYLCSVTMKKSAGFAVTIIACENRSGGISSEFEIVI